ncbi:MAG TPA: HAD-IA family hydrolase [Steroidobacteraceae bacterium]|nr:HAD-IA family hydrolase [Steroidobacteraceae bacterium]
MPRPASGARARPAPVRAVLFDLDGTLLDTAPDLGRALNALRGEESLPPIALPVIRPRVSDGATGLVQLGFPGASPERTELLRQRLLVHYGSALALESRPFEGVPEMLAALDGRGMHWGIVTNKSAAFTTPLLQQVGLAAGAAIIVSGDTTAQRKPHPEPLLHAARQLGLAPAHCVYVGDAERDAQAASAAGMRMLVALFGYAEAARARAWTHAGLLERPAQLLEWVDATGGE